MWIMRNGPYLGRPPPWVAMRLGAVYRVKLGLSECTLSLVLALVGSGWGENINFDRGIEKPATGANSLPSITT